MQVYSFINELTKNMRNSFLFLASSFLILLSPRLLSAQIDQHVSLSADTLRFDTLCGEMQCKDILLRNRSANPLQIISLSSTQRPFSRSATPAFGTPLTIPAGGSATVRFCYSPTIPGLVGSQNNLVLTVDTGDAANLARDTLVLQGISRSASVNFDPPELNFGGILLAKQTCQKMTITNTGNYPINLTELLSLGAPYRITPAISGLLAPGASVTLDICFEPTVEGFYPDTLRLANGACRSPAEFVVNGAGMNIAPDIGPILQLSPPTINFDTTRCGTTKCRDITIRNVGNTVTVITNPEQIIAPFSGTFPPTPLSLEPDSAITVRVCYAPPDAPRIDTQLVRFTADSRYSLTIATLFDISGSMQFPMGTPPEPKMDVANRAGQLFIENLVRDTLRGVVDTAAVYQFANISSFRRNAGYTVDVVTLQNAVPTLDSVGGGTCLYDALRQVVTELQLENLPGRRVLVVVTDGKDEDCGAGTTVNDVINAANAAGVLIYTIGIGDQNDVEGGILTNIASQTAGRYFFAPDADSLVAVYQQISEDLSKNAAGYIVLRGEGAAPVLQITPPTIDYDSVKVDSTRCFDVTLTNVGNAPYPGGALEGIDPPFATTTPIAPPLLPGESVNIEMCFGPDRLRIRRDTLKLSYFRCADDSLKAELVGVGYDSVVVEMRDVHTGRPGSIIEIPIHLLDPMPDLYAVDSLRVQVTFNKTMLAETSDFVVTDGTATAEMEGRIESITFDADTAIANLFFYNGRLRSDLPVSELARLRFLVLLGNVLESPIEATTVTLADGNPKVGKRNPALFRIDSICYLPDRLLDASARYNGIIKSVTAENGNLVVQYEAILEHEIEPLPVRLELYDRLGQMVGVLDKRTLDTSGEFKIISNPTGLVSGLYFIRLTIAEKSWTVSGMVMNNE